MSQIIGPLWTKQAKLEGGLDPLGLDRVSDRLTSELMPGMSVNVNMARYFSLFPWLFDTAKTEDQEKLLDEILRAEKAYALGTYLVHDGVPCTTGVAGGDTAAKIWDINKQINLDKVSWLSNGGVYLGYYKGPLFKLGLLETDSKGKVVVTKIGKPLAESFHRAVSFTDWAKNGRSRSIATRTELKQFGRQACPCSLSNAPSEMNALRQLFFETPTEGGRTLAKSFGFILSLMEQCERYEFANPELNQSFRLAVYYRKIYTDKDRVVKFKVLKALDEIVTRWRSFQAHDYFSFALESFFTIWLEIMFANQGQRLTIPQFMDCMDNKEFLSALKGLLGFRFSGTSMRDLKVEQLITALLKKAGLSGFSAQNSAAFDRIIGLEHDLSEENIEDKIWGRYKTGGQHSQWCAETIVLLLILYTRFYYQFLQGQNQPGWDRYEAFSSQSTSDLGLPRCYWMFPLGELMQMSVYDFLVNILNHNVIQQALTMREERRRDLVWFSEAGFSGLGEIAPMTQAYQYHFSFDSFRAYRNTSKLANALAMLSDIKYATNNNGFWQLTREGRNRLQKSFGS
jgi:hypothetical protein